MTAPAPSLEPSAGASTTVRQRADWRLVLAALVIVALQRLLLFAMGVWHGAHSAFRWDANWYHDVAVHGYVWTPGHRPGTPPSSLAFFPLLPMMGRFIHRVCGLGIYGSMEAIALLGLVLAVWGIIAVGTVVAGRRTGLLLAALWGAAPRGLVTIMPYTEGIFTAAAAWCLYFLLRRRWWPAAAVCAIAGLTRSSAATLVITLGVAWLIARWRDLRSPRVLLQGVGLALSSASGLLAYIGYVAHRTGRWDGYVAVQHEWHMQMGSPLASVRQIDPMWHMHREWWVYNYTVIPSLVALVLVVAVLFARPTPTLASFTLVSTLWTWCATDYFWCKPRFMLPVFVVGLAPARLLARARPAVVVVVLVLLTVWSCWADMFQWAAHGAP